MPTKSALGIFFRFPALGKVKKRLANEIGENAALTAYESMLEATIRNVSRLRGIELYGFYEGKNIYHPPLYPLPSREGKVEGYFINGGEFPLPLESLEVGNKRKCTSVRCVKLKLKGGIMKIGARNQIVGKVIDIKKGDVMAKVKVMIPAESTMTSVFTVESLKDLGIKKGDKVLVVAKAVNVMLMKE